MPSPRALACPASLKGVLSARAAAASLAAGLREWADADELPVADGGEGTLGVLHAALGGAFHAVDVRDAFGRPRKARWLALPDGTAAVEAAEAIPLDPARLDPIAASSRGLGEVIAAVGAPRSLLVCLGGTATVDGGAGLLEVVDALPVPTRVACDATVPLLDAARLFAAQKGATPQVAAELERRLSSREDLLRVAEIPGAGAAGGLGAALAALGADLVPGSQLVLDAIGFDPAGYDLVVTGEGTVDTTTTRGKAPGEVVKRCAAAAVACVLFGGRVLERPPGVRVVALSGVPDDAEADLLALGSELRREARG
jgi:glycerate 2-kinase